MLKGKLSLDDFLPDAANDPDIEAARRKVSVTVDPDVPYTVSLVGTHHGRRQNNRWKNVFKRETLGTGFAGRTVIDRPVQ